MTEQIKKILIIKPSALGDIVLAMPAVCCLAKSFPEAQINWFVRPEYSSLLENHPCVHKAIIFDRRKLGKWWYKPSAFAELIRLIRQLRSEKYDIVFDFQGRFRSAIFGWFSGCKKRIGIAGTQEFTSLFYTQRVVQSETSIHLVDFFIDMVCQAGAKKGKVEFGLKPQQRVVEEVKKILASHHSNPDKYAVFVTGATIEAKRWPIENFAALADKVYKKYKFNIVTVGTEAEREAAEKIRLLTDVPLINLAGKTNVEQLVALLAGAEVVVSNDTGPAHIAAGLSVPMVLIFGFTNPLRVGPYGRAQTVAAIDADKRGREIESTNPAHDIKNVTVEDVFEKIIRQSG